MTRTVGFTWTVADGNLVSADDVWGDVLVERGRADPRIVAVTADLAHSTKIGRFKEAFPERFVNVGICEQNMMALAAGLAATGLIPVVSTYAAFASLRAAEFVRNDIAYNARNVKIVGTLAGVSFGQGGPTHHTLEDLALLRAVPGITVVCSSDGPQTGEALAAALDWDGPVYIRCARGMEPPVPRPDGMRFEIGRALELAAGTDATVIACGTTVLHAVRAAERLAEAGASVGVLEVHTIKPLDADAILAAARRTRRLVTVEDHNVIGGLGTAVADVIAGAGLGCALRKLGHQDRYAPLGIPEDLQHIAGFDEDAIVTTLGDLLKVEVGDDADWDEP